MKVIGIVNRKGGAGKTHTAVGLAAAWQDAGHQVMLLDTDPNGSASRWLEEAAVVPGLPAEAENVAAGLEGGQGLFDLAVIDTPPNDADAIAAVAAVCDLVVVPLAPSPVEIDQLPDTIGLLPDGTQWVVAPVRVRAVTRMAKTFDDQMAAAGIPMTAASVPLQEAIAQSFQRRVPILPFKALAAELLTLTESKK